MFILKNSEQLLPTSCEYSMFLALTKIKSRNIKIIGDEKNLYKIKNLREN